MKAAILLMLFLTPAVAQNSRRAVVGTVTNQDGAPLKGAIVHLKDTNSLRVRSFITQADGGYRFYGLDSDAGYELNAKYEGHRSSTRTLSRFNSRPRVVINLEVPVNNSHTDT